MNRLKHKPMMNRLKYEIYLIYKNCIMHTFYYVYNFVLKKATFVSFEQIFLKIMLLKIVGKKLKYF